MDEIDIRLLEILQLDGRITISDLSKKLCLSRPSISERLAKLQEKGIIEGFSARVPPASVGRGVIVFIQLNELSFHAYNDFEAEIKCDPDIIECHRLTGPVSYILKAAVTGVDHLSTLIDRLIPYGNVSTSIVLSSPIPYRSLLPSTEDKEPV